METRSDLETELVSQLQVASNSSLFPATRITALIKNAYIRATELFIWNDLVKAKCTGSYAGYEYYDCPSDFRSGTIMRLEMDGKPYPRKNFEDYLEYKYNNSTSTEKMFANFARQYFIWPIPTADGTNNITLWGAVQATALANPTSETIFTGNKEDCNLAVVGLAFAMAMKRIDKSLAETEEKSAIAVLSRFNSIEQSATQRDQRIEHPRFNVPNYFSGRGGSTPIGN